MRFKHHGLIALAAALTALMAACQTTEPQSRDTQSQQSTAQTREPLTAEAPGEGPSCIEKMREVARTLEPFQESASLPDFETTTDALVEMSGKTGRALLESAATAKDSNASIYLELRDDGTVHFAESDEAVEIDNVQTKFRELRNKASKEAKMLGVEPNLSFSPVLLVGEDARPAHLAALLEQVAAINPSTRIGFVYAEPADAKTPDVLPPLTMETQQDIRKQYARMLESLRASHENDSELDEASRAFADKIYGKPWNQACHRTWMLAKHDHTDFESAKNTIDGNERACCSEVNWDAVKFLSVPSDHRRSYGRWRLLEVTLRAPMNGPMGKMMSEQPELTYSTSDSYRAFLEQVAGLEDVPYQLVIERSP